MPESRKYLQSGELSTFKASQIDDSSSTIASVNKTPMEKTHDIDDPTYRKASIVEAHVEPPSNSVKLQQFFVYFSEWRHLKVLLGTASTWFLVDVAFYGLNLNQSVLLAAIGFSKGKTEYDTLLKNAYGNLIIAAAGYVPGYFLTIAFIEILGRRWIQIQGFLVCALMFGIIAGDYNGLGTAPKFACFTIAQVCLAGLLTHLLTEYTHAVPSAVLQLRPERNHFHRPRRSLPFSSARLRPWRQRCHRQTGSYTLRCLIQLPQQPRSHRCSERHMDLLRLQRLGCDCYFLPGTGNEGRRCRCKRLRGMSGGYPVEEPTAVNLAKLIFGWSTLFSHACMYILIVDRTNQQNC